MINYGTTHINAFATLDNHRFNLKACWLDTMRGLTTWAEPVKIPAYCSGWSALFC